MNKFPWMETILAAIALITGATLLSLQFGWKVGVGIALLVWFHKAVERG